MHIANELELLAITFCLAFFFLAPFEMICFLDKMSDNIDDKRSHLISATIHH